MTNTLHRKGDRGALQKDFVVFALPKGQSDLIEKLLQFTQICLKHHPVNMNIASLDGLRGIDTDHIQEIMQDKITNTATFDNMAAVTSVVAELVEADLGISINISGLLEEVQACCKKAGISRHSAEQSIGVFGQTDKLPPREIVEISTLCGHGLVSFNLIKKVLEEIKLGRMTPDRGAWHLARPCQCGAFNPTRARELLEAMTLKG